MARPGCVDLNRVFKTLRAGISKNLSLRLNEVVEIGFNRVASNVAERLVVVGKQPGERCIKKCIDMMRIFLGDNRQFDETTNCKPIVILNKACAPSDMQAAKMNRPSNMVMRRC